MLSPTPTPPDPEERRWLRLVTSVASRRVPTFWALLLAGCGVVLLLRPPPSWWAGAALLVGAAVTVWHAYRDPLLRAGHHLNTPRRVLGRRVVPGTLLLELAYVGVLVWVATVMMLDVVHGVRPVSHDHTVHYFKAFQLHEDFLSRGRLHGFSHRWFAGYPVNYLYPFGTDLFVNAVHLASLGTLSMARAYGLAFLLFHVLTGYAGYRFGRMLGGPHAGLITGFLLLTDMSAFRFGGWSYTVEYGVWPQALSLVFGLLAITRVPAIYERRGLTHIGSFALLMGAAIVTHPIQLIQLGILLLVAPLAGAFVPEVKTAAGTMRLLLAYALCVLVAAAGLLPFLSTRDQTTPMGVWWDTTLEMGKGLLELDAFPGTVGYVLPLAILGAAIMLRSRRFALMFTALMALLVPAVSSSTFLDELHLSSVSSAFAKIQWLRMSTMVKPFWFAMAAYFVVAFLRKSHILATAALEARKHGRPVLRDVMLSILVAFLTLPIVVPMCQAFFTAKIAKTLQTEQDRALDRDRAELVQWLKRELPRGDGFYRLCINTGHNHDLLDLGAELPVPIFKRGFTPAENFIYKMNIEDPVIMEAVNVRYMITKKPMPASDYEHVKSFGIYRVYLFKRWQPQPFVVRGEGEVTLVRFESDEIVLDAGPGSKGLLRLNVSHFPRWHASRDGKPVSVWPTSLSEQARNTGFMTVALEPGRYRFAFEPSLLDRLSAPLSLLGVLLALSLIVADRFSGGLHWLRRAADGVTGAFEHLSAPGAARLRTFFLVLLVSGCVAGFLYLGERHPKLPLEELSGAAVTRVRFDFLEELRTARAAIDYQTAQRRCKRLGDHFVCRSENGALDNDKYVASTPAEIEEYRMVRCIRARPEENARLSIHYPRVPSGDAIVGYYGVERAGRLLRLTRPVDFEIHVEGKRIYQGATQSDNKMHWFRADVGGPSREVDVRFTVSAKNVSKRYFCFYAQMADLGVGQERETERTRGAPAAGEDDEEGE